MAKLVANRLPLRQRWKRSTAEPGTATATATASQPSPPAQPQHPAPPPKPPSRVLRHTPIGGLLEALSGYLSPQAVAKIHEACLFGAHAHEGQTRQSGEAYFHHPLAVAGILGEMHMDSRTIIAAVLHDVVEDTHTTIAQLAEHFGSDVAEMVDGVSKITLLEQDSKEHAEAASFRKMFLATAKDIRVIIIKLADRLHNMNTLDSLRLEKKRRVARQTLELYAPIANRLGMRELAQRLEDLSLRNLYPKRYDAIAKRLNSRKRNRKAMLNKLCDRLQLELLGDNITAQVYGREKDIYSVYRKMQQKKLSLRDVKDIHAIRIVTETRPQCYHALGVVHQLCKPRLKSFKDYIAIPKVNGYQSLHSVVIEPQGQPVEVQIRSQAMHRVAEKGVAAHWLYKLESTGEHAPRQLAQEWLDDFLETQHKAIDSGEFLEHLKTDLHPDGVYVFTPKGDIKRLALGATALDFAYAVHTDVGNRCIGARIAQQIVPLYEKLNNGDHIEIMTARNARPLPAWLNYAKTPKARTSIRHYLNQQEDKEALKLGGKLLKHALSKQGYRRLRIPSAHKVALLQHLNMKDWMQLLRDIGFGKRQPTLVAKQLIAEVNDPTHTPQQTHPHPTTTITIEGTERLLVTHAECCHPIPGDDIIGVMSDGRGLYVHRVNCPACTHVMRHPDNSFPLTWPPTTTTKFKVKVNIVTRDQPGVLASVSNIIAKRESNILDISFTSRQHDIASMQFIIEVTDRTHLADIMRRLHTEPSVITLTRL